MPNGTKGKININSITHHCNNRHTWFTNTVQLTHSQLVFKSWGKRVEEVLTCDSVWCDEDHVNITSRGVYIVAVWTSGEYATFYLSSGRLWHVKLCNHRVPNSLLDKVIQSLQYRTTSVRFLLWLNASGTPGQQRCLMIDLILLRAIRGHDLL